MIENIQIKSNDPVLELRRNSNLLTQEGVSADTLYFLMKNDLPDIALKAFDSRTLHVYNHIKIKTGEYKAISDDYLEA